jgi:hypothetical protein
MSIQQTKTADRAPSNLGEISPVGGAQSNPTFLILVAALPR